MKIKYLHGSNVVSIQPSRNRAKFPAIAQIEAYWEGLRNGRPMPARSEVDPRGLTEVLEYAFILEKVAPGLARIRLAGSHINDLMGMEVRGMPVSSLFLPEARAELQKALETAFTGPASVRFNLAGDTGFTRPSLEAQMYFAPLKDETGAPTRILGALQSSGRIGRAPRRFNIRNMEVNALLQEVGEAAPNRNTRIPGFAEHATGFKAAAVSAKAPAAKNPHLQLVTSTE